MQLEVVYVDDEPAMCEMFVDNFATANIAIRVFGSPKALLAAELAGKPDLFILDYRLPGMTGDELAGLLPADVPKILITGELALRPKSSFIQQLSKPFDLDAMEKFLQEQFLKKQMQAVI